MTKNLELKKIAQILNLKKFGSKVWSLKAYLKFWLFKHSPKSFPKFSVTKKIPYFLGILRLQENFLKKLPKLLKIQHSTKKSSKFNTLKKLPKLLKIQYNSVPLAIDF
jgi:hypothetical protein